MLISVRKALLLLLCGLAATSPVAAAQEDEVFVDPRSPSGKEYALPIDRAREEGSTRTQTPKPPAREQKTPLFGEGVDGGDGSASTTEQPAASSSTQDPEGATRDTDVERTRAREASKRRAAKAKADAAAAARAHAGELARSRALKAQAAAPEGGLGAAAIVGAGVGVLLIGGLIGLWLRRRAAS